MRTVTLNPLDVVKLPNLCPSIKTVILDDVGSYIPNRNSICRSLDGLVCFYNPYNCIHVVNPITRWSRSIPHARYQSNNSGRRILLCDLGFGKDKFTNLYKLVWLYNSFELGLQNATTCEVFEFSTNIWRYVTPAPCRILDGRNPVYLDGSLYWFTDHEDIVETRILSFDLHTEKFQIITKAPFFQATCKQIMMCNLNNHLCVSQKKWPRQEIWSLDNSDMTWEKMYSLELPTDSPWFARNLPLLVFPCVTPVMIMKNKKTLLLFDVQANKPSLVMYDPELKSYDLCYQLDHKPHGYYGTVLSYIPSLI